MARMVTTARGEVVDFDAIIIKQQLAQAPMNIDVARRKEFIDSKEGSSRSKPEVQVTEAVQSEQTVQVQPVNQSTKEKKAKE